VINHAECVELAEQTGLIMSLGGWLLRSACEQSLRWWRSGAITPLPVSVALARSQCTDPDLVAKVLRIVRDCELPTGRLRLGLPAGAFGEHREETADNGRLLSRSGISVGLQDFGGTVDDLACLEDFPVSAVRLAPTLVERLAHGPVEESLAARAARNLMETARLAGASVLVSDVKTSDQADWWRQAGCELAGGPLFGAAVAAEDIAPRLGLRRV
jgi:EAL domain-containing protein (putative c-di-GMP-specific phosphodiesterase class I)